MTCIRSAEALNKLFGPNNRNLENEESNFLVLIITMLSGQTKVKTFSFFFCFVSLAPQSDALSRGVFRDFQPTPSIPNPLIAFEHLSRYTEKHLILSLYKKYLSLTVCDSL